MNPDICYTLGWTGLAMTVWTAGFEVFFWLRGEG
jgi:hypothetical protein